jgi:hypothetical protein
VWAGRVSHPPNPLSNGPRKAPEDTPSGAIPVRDKNPMNFADYAMFGVLVAVLVLIVWLVVFFREACRLGCEGIVSKRHGSPYRSGRSVHWVKVKNPKAPAVKREAEEDWGQ